jgi:uncharacterized protein (DUF302 family)
MSYCFAKTLDAPPSAVIERVKAALASRGFGILTEIDVAATMKAKLGADMPFYRIFGACNPKLAYQALQAEPRIGAMLPCNVIVREHPPGKSEVCAIDPVASMQAIDNPALGAVAEQARALLRDAVETL